MSSGLALIASSLKILFSSQCDRVESNLDELHELHELQRGVCREDDQHLVGKNKSKFLQGKICRE